jgi:hypothetical protein
LPVTLSRFMKANYRRAIGGRQASALIQVLFGPILAAPPNSRFKFEICAWTPQTDAAQMDYRSRLSTWRTLLNY